MDGIDSGRGIVLLGSTNRGDILDKALLRPGRFDRHIIIDLPTALERQEMFEIYLSKIKLDRHPQYYSKRLAQMTPRFSGADIANIVNEAAIRAASLKRKQVTVDDLDASLQRVLAGSEKRSRSMVDEEREIVSIIPRTSARLGFAQYSPRERKLLTKEEVTKSAYAQVQVFGMSDAVGLLSFPVIDDNKKNELEFYKKPFSMKLQQMIDRVASFFRAE
ncbi:unnamed protein product [Gongylonema pulchrum]|uniref:ATPase_AAA_core domain-containing protein n=1 Tax=Gongylonema pulchrum TaxID=637853 RepID=A0A183EQT9_9BILA|nr:unnamed protein product [Gongylonema pulchrum]